MEKKFEDLLRIMNKLRAPGGCPWDREQTIDSLKPYLIEEAYEVLESMDKSPEKHKEELGDLLLQVIFQSEIMSEQNEFDIYDVINSISQKLIRRHPHVFGEIEVKDSEEVMVNWENIKKKEKNNKDRKSILDGIPIELPAIMKAEKIQNKAAKAGFDWNNVDGAITKMEEELEEFRYELKNGNKEKLKDELGDVFFSLINVARLSEINSYDALLSTIKKFEKRFRYIEEKTDIKKADLEEMDRYWEEAKNEIG